MTTPGDMRPALDVATGIEELTQAPERLGNQWGLRYATVINVVDARNVIGRYDNEVTDVNVPMISLVGSLAASARVAVLFIPPSGNYIITTLTGAITVASTVDSVPVSTTSGVFIPLTGGNNAGLVFVAGASGRTLCHFRLSQSGTDCITSVRLGTGGTIGAGTVIHASNDLEAIRGAAGEFGTTILFAGLTPGLTYNAQMEHRSGTGSNCFWARRQVIVVPTP